MSTFTILTTINGSSLNRLGSVALAWTRATTTATVTQTAHGMVTGDQINVTVTLDATAITLGAKSITFISANTYSFVCLNAGAVSGTITASHIDNYLINGGYLTIDQDTRYGAGQNTSAALGNITLSATLGGTVEFNSTLVRIIPYNTGTGNVPTFDTTISQGSASGKLIGVYSALNVAPTAVGVAMPVSGFIKIRQWNSVSYTATTLTGIGATATGVDRVGWLDIVGVDTFACTVNRLNTFKVRGEYYDFLGITTDGTRATTYQIPSNGGIIYLPGVEVETGVATGIYDFYPCAGSLTALLANIATDEVRGKWCWISTAGLLRFGHDGTNLTGGFIPTAGRKIRIPNIFFMCCTAASQTVNVLPNITLATRYDFNTAGGGVIDIDKCSMNWYPSFNQPFSVGLTNCNFLTQLLVSEIASPIAWSNVGIGQEALNSQIGLSMALCFAGGTMNKCTWTRANLTASGAFLSTLTDISGFTITNERNHALGGNRGNSNTAISVQTRVANSTWLNTTIGGGRILMTTNTSVSYTNSIYYDNPATTTPTATPQNTYEIGTNCQKIVFDGLSFGGLTLCQPYSGILSIGAAGCQDIKLRNLGTYASPLIMGGAYVDATWTRATTVMTFTKVAHGLKVNDLIAVNIISDVAPRAVTNSTASLWTIASAPTADTFTVTVTNAGAASGTCSYYPTMAGQLITLAASAAANNVKVQRCYTPGLRIGLRSGDNSSKNVIFESVFGTEWGVQLIPELNAKMKMVQSLPALTAQQACYGTHWFDYYTTGVPPNTSAVAWTRVTTTATITSTNHGLRTGDLINVTISSDIAAIIRGQKTITAVTSNTFTFTCLNAGAASGTLTFIPYNGRIAIQMNESTSDTISEVTLLNGAAFTSAGGLYMPIIGHQAIFETPYYVLGHLNFPITEVIMAGGTLTNYDITYAIDNGVGYSTFKNLSYPRVGGGGANASTNITMTSTTGVSVGDYVFGTNVAPNARVVSITNATTVAVDLANIGTVSGTLRFSQLPNEVNIPATGAKIKVRAVTSTTNVTSITSLYFFTQSNNTTRAYTYPLDTFNLTLTGLVTGSDVVVLSAGTETVLNQIDQNVGSTWVYTYETPQVIDIFVSKAGYVPFYIRNYALQSSNASLPIAQTVDRNYIT